MPPRKRPKRSGVAATASLEASSAADDAGAPIPPSANPSKKAVRGRRGGLKDMPQMPLDILMEVISSFFWLSLRLMMRRHGRFTDIRIHAPPRLA